MTVVSKLKRTGEDKEVNPKSVCMPLASDEADVNLNFHKPPPAHGDAPRICIGAHKLPIVLFLPTNLFRNQINVPGFKHAFHFLLIQLPVNL